MKPKIDYQNHAFSGKYQDSVRLSPYQYQLFMSAMEKPRAKIILNELKQQAMTNTISALFGKLFPNAPFTKQLKMLIFPLKDVSFKTELKFSDLGVKRKTIIRKLIASNMLPENFYEVKQAS